MNNINTPANEAEFRSLTDPRTGGTAPLNGEGFSSDDLNKLLGAIPGIGNLLSSILGGQDIQQGLQQEQGDIRQGIRGQQQALGQSITGLNPFLQTGQIAGSRELSLLKGGQDPAQLISGIASQFEQSPEQKAIVQAGTGAVQNRLEAQGINLSGAADQAMAQFAQNQTGNQLNQFISQVLGGRGQTISGLSGLAGRGLQAGEIETQARQRSAENIASLLASLGQSQIGAAGARGKDTSGIIGGLGSAIGSILPFVA